MGMIKKAFSLWLAMYAYSCTPHRWTSYERVWKETLYRMVYPFAAQLVDYYATVDGLLPILDAKKLVPVEPPPPVLYLDGNGDFEYNYATLKAAWQNEDCIVVWKNFTQGMMDNWKDEAYLKSTLKLEKEYDFLQYYSNMNGTRMTMGEAIDVGLEKLYMGFNYHILKDNADTLYADFTKMLASYGEEFVELIGADEAVHHAFVYKGNAYYTGMHQAPVADWFFMISNAKVWRFVQPQYTPYMGQFSRDGVSSMSKYDYLPDDADVPFTDVHTNAGDFMYFPPHWWHQVRNKDPEAVGMGFGFRPNPVKDLFATMAFPLRAKTGVAAHRFFFFFGMVRNRINAKISARISSTLNQRSGLANRMEGFQQLVGEINEWIPGWSWDSHPEMSCKNNYHAMLAQYTA